MRTLPPRPAVPKATATRLALETAQISAIADAEEMKKEAQVRYKRYRRAVWFRPVLQSLAIVAGEGERCMCCSGSESAQVEHYLDKATYPKKTFEWENFLWTCGICNLAKGARFDENCRPMNPLDETVWDHFFIDEFGNLSAKWDVALNALDKRALGTILSYNLDRQALQETRLARLKELRTFADDNLAMKTAGLLTVEEMQDRLLVFHASPLQPDVADFFLNGPGQAEEPFNELFAAADL